MELIPAINKNESLVAEMDEFLADKEHLFIWWLGQSGYLLQFDGQRVLIDPYLSDSLTRKYAKTNKPHTRMSELVIRPELLRGISVVSSSHNHTDHLDGDTLKPILKNNPGIQLIIPEANREFVTERLGCEKPYPIGLNDGLDANVHGIRFHGIPAKHNELERDENGNCRFMGYVIEFGKWKIYHSGDTLWFEGMVDLLKPFAVDLALLPINGDDPVRGVAGNLDSSEAAELGKAIDAKWVIPCHYDLFEFNTADVNDFVEAAKKIDQNFCVLRGGECFRLPNDDD